MSRSRKSDAVETTATVINVDFEQPPWRWWATRPRRGCNIRLDVEGLGEVTGRILMEKQHWWWPPGLDRYATWEQWQDAIRAFFVEGKELKALIFEALSWRRASFSCLWMKTRYHEGGLHI